MNELLSKSARSERLFNLAFEAMSTGSVWVAERANAYVRVLLKGLGGSILAFVLIGAVYAVGIKLKSGLLLAVAMLLFGVVFVAFMVITAPILTGVAAAARTFTSVRLVVQVIGAIALFSIVVALAFLYIPITAATAVVVPLAGLVLGVLWVITGNKQSLSMIATRVSMVLVVTVGGAMLAALAPESAQRLRALGGSLDRSLARGIGAVSISADTANRVQIDSIEQFRKVVFFHPGTSEPQLWYAVTSDGTFEWFTAPGYHPTTGEALLPVSRAIVTRLRVRLEREAMSKQSQVPNVPPQTLPAIAASPTLPDTTTTKVQPTPSAPPAIRLDGRGAQPSIQPRSPAEPAAVPLARIAPTIPTVVAPPPALPSTVMVPSTMPVQTARVPNSGPASPAEACGSRVFVALARCLQRECDSSRFRTHPDCVRAREEAERQQQRY